MQVISKAKAKYIKSLQLKKYRQQSGSFLVEGEKNLLELLASDIQIEELVLTKAFAETVEARFPKRYHTVANQSEIERLGTLKSNNAGLAVAKIPQEINSSDLAKGKVLMLEDINDPGNLGTIIRIADWYGINDIICSPGTADCYNPKVIQATKGSFTRVRVHYSELPGFIDQIDLPVYGMVLDGEDLHQVLFPTDFIMLIGSESHGISSALANKLTHKITIPRIGGAESLNAAIATAIVCDRVFFR